MQLRFLAVLALTSVLAASCGRKTFRTQARPLPAGEAEAIHLFGNEHGEVYASWLEREGGEAYRFRYALFAGGSWSEPSLIAEGDQSWFVNWADMPRLAPYKENPQALAAFWLKKSGRLPYDHHILISQSMDGGQSWSEPFMPYDTQVPAFFGLCRLLPLPNGRILAAWQDGRETVVYLPHAGRTVPNFKGHVSLRAVEFGPDGQLHHPARLDSLISELCPFDMALTAKGPVVVYRDMEEDKVKDIVITRRTEESWTAPQLIFRDNWSVGYHTLEGPAVDAMEEQLAVAWYSSPGDMPQVKLCFSFDSGKTFTQPVRIDEGQPLGKVDVAFYDKKRVMVSWVEKKEEGAYLMAALLNDKGELLKKRSIAPVSEAAPAGFPVLARAEKGLLLAWKDGEDGFAPLQAVWLRLRR